MGRREREREEEVQKDNSILKINSVQSNESMKLPVSSKSQTKFIRRKTILPNFIPTRTLGTFHG